MKHGKSRPNNYLATLPTELAKLVWSYAKAEVVVALPMLVERKDRIHNVPTHYRNLGSDPVRCKYLNDAYRRACKTGKGRMRELDYWKLVCDLERPIVWHTCILGWNEWFVRRYQLYSKDVGQGGINWNSIYEPGKLTLAGWFRLMDPKQSYDTRAPIWSEEGRFKYLGKSYRCK
jgi:hypothetical protein